MPEPRVFISVIIPALNEEAYIVPTIGAIRTAIEQLKERDGLEVEVIVVDNKTGETPVPPIQEMVFGQSLIAKKRIDAA